MSVFTAAELAQKLGAVVVGDPACQALCFVEVADGNKPGAVVLALEKKAIAKLAGVSPAIVVLQKDIPELNATKIITTKGKEILIELLDLFNPEAAASFVSERAFVSATATIGKNVTIYPGVFIGEHVVIGDNTILFPNVVVYEGCQIGANCRIHATAVIGADGFGYIFHKGQHAKVPQKGIVIIEDNVEIGAGTTIDRATISATVIGAGTKIDNKVQIAHNVRIGKHCILAGSSNVAGSSILDDHVIVAGGAGIGDNLHIGSGAIICAYTVVTSDVAPKAKMFATPTGEEYMVAMRKRAKLNKLCDQ